MSALAVEQNPASDKRARRTAVRLTTVVAGLCAGLFTYWVWRKQLGIPLQLSIAIHMDDPSSPIRPWAPWWVPSLLMAVTFMAIWRLLAVRARGFSLIGGALAMVLAVPLVFVVAGICLEYGALLQSPRGLGLAELAAFAPLVVVGALQMSMVFMTFSGVWLIPAAVAGLLIASLGRLCSRAA